MNLKRVAITAATAGAMGIAALGLGTGMAQAKPHQPGPPIPPIPVPGHVADWGPPGHNPWGPPGQVTKDPLAYGAPPYLEGVPPGHWGNPELYGLPGWWIPRDLVNVVKNPLKVVWDPNAVAWGVWWADRFIPFTP